MDAAQRVERVLAAALRPAVEADGPPLLAAAIRHAVFPGGARVRPLLCLAVAGACGNDDPALAEAAAAAVELLHCASLVHDDLPCFDDAPTRRGRASVHAAFGQPLAVLAGDALIVLAFQTVALAAASARAPQRLGPLVGTLGDAVGMPRGLCAGQAWESEPVVDLHAYQCAKTGALFAAAAAAGATAAGAPSLPWRAVGERLGEAYQVADDIGDALAAEQEMGKPGGRDAALGRPSAVRSLGVAGAVRFLEEVTEQAVAAIPACRGAAELGALIRLQARRLVPKAIAAQAA